ncbi:MAG TPA: signal peptidase II [Ardenticatenaceae bacterium]|jgi:signal peptidase II
MESQASTRSYRWLLWVTAATVLLTDQLTKTLVIQNLNIGESWRPWAGTPILELFALTHTKNSGAAFGMLQSGGIFFTLVAIVVSAAIVWYYRRLPRERWWLFLTVGLMLGGALGNLTDRLRLGWVTDFIHIGTFFIFNVADSAVVVGVTLLAWEMWREDEQKRQAATVEQASSAAITPLEVRGLAPQRGGARAYTMPNHNGRARLEPTAIAWSQERSSHDDGE